MEKEEYEQQLKKIEKEFSYLKARENASVTIIITLFLLILGGYIAYLTELLH